METTVGELVGPAHASGRASVAPDDLLRFLRQLQVKLKAGPSVDKALAALATETKNKRLRVACKGMQAQLVAKRSLANAMAAQLGMFDACVLRLIDEGEQTGNLRSALAAATDHVQRAGELRERLRSAMAKPLDALLLILLAVFVAAVALSFLAKEFLPAAAGVRSGTLSAADVVAIRAAGLLRAFWPAVGVAGALNFAAVHLLPRIPRTRALLDSLALRLPLLRGAYRQTRLACFAWTIGILLRAGVRLDEAMQVAAVNASDKVMRDTITGTTRAIEAGKPYIDAMADAGLLRRRDMSAISAAERRGELANAILSAAENYQREAKDKVARLRVVSQTAVVLVLGLAIVSVVLTLYVPVFVLR